MGKIIYTERDIELLAARGVTEIPVNDDVIVTGVAREKMDKLGMRLRFVAPGEATAVGLGTWPAQSTAAPESGPARPGGSASPPDAEREGLVERVKAAVIARLGPQVDAAVVERAVRAVMGKTRPASG